MENKFYEEEINTSEIEILEPMPLEASDELIEDLIEESKLDAEEIEKVIQETEEAIAKSDTQDGEEEAEQLDEIGEGLLADDELDEMELVSEFDYTEEVEAEPIVSAEENLDEEPTKISELIENKRYAELKTRLEEIPYVDIAEVFNEVEPKYHAVILRLLGKEAAADVFVELDTETQRVLIESVSDRELAAILEEMYLDDTMDLIEEMPASVVKKIIRSSSGENRHEINRLLK